MKRMVLGLSLMGALPLLSFQDAKQDGDRISSEAVAKAGALFKKACASCHFLPDTKDMLDVAWLGQVRETS